MTGTIPTVMNNRASTCPHGLPPGACPICNGMGGGGSTQRKDEPRRPGEMTYQECYAQWKLMQRADAQKQAMQEAMIRNAELAAKFQQQLANITSALTSVLDKIQTNLPKPVAEVFANITNNILKPLINIIKELPQMLQTVANAVDVIRNEIAKVAEKLNALLGEMQNFIEKKISDAVKSFKKRFKKLLSIFGLDEEDYEDDEKIKEELSVFKQFEIEKLKEAFRKLITPKDKEEEIARRTHKRGSAQV